jgi:hypothetical protein
MTGLAEEIKKIKKDIENLKTHTDSAEVFDAILPIQEVISISAELSDPVGKDKTPICGDMVCGFFEAVSSD